MEWIKILDKAPRDMHNVLVLSVHNAIYLAKYNEISSEFYPVAHMVSDTDRGCYALDAFTRKTKGNTTTEKDW